MKCPTCGADIRWNWCQDEYVINGKGINGKHMIIPKNDYFLHTIEVIQCGCNNVIGTIVTCDKGCFVYNTEDYDVDWELEENCAEEDNGNLPDLQ